MSADNKTVSSRLKITNKGALDGQFSIDYKGELPIKFVPSKDTVPAYSTAYIRVNSMLSFNKNIILNNRCQFGIGWFFY